MASGESVANSFHLLWVLNFEFQQLLKGHEDQSCMVFSPNISLEHRNKKCAPWWNADRVECRDHWQMSTISQQALCWNTCNTLPVSSSVIYPHTILEDPHLLLQISPGFSPCGADIWFCTTRLTRLTFVALFIEDEIYLRNGKRHLRKDCIAWVDSKFI